MNRAGKKGPGGNGDFAPAGTAARVNRVGKRGRREAIQNFRRRGPDISGSLRIGAAPVSPFENSAFRQTTKTKMAKVQLWWRL